MADDATTSGSNRLELWLKFIQFILGSVVVAVVTLLVNNRIQTREVEIKEQDQMGKFLEQALTEDVGVRYRFAQYFAAVTRSPDVRARWATYLIEVGKEKEAKEHELRRVEEDVKRLRAEVKGPEAANPAIELDEKVAKAEELKAALDPRPSGAAQAGLTSRVYFHIKDEAQRSGAQELARKAAAALGIVVPGVQRLDGVPAVTELRYFRTAEEPEARSIDEFLAKNGLHAKLTYVPGFEGSTRIRPRHYELWIAAGETLGG